MPEVVFDSSFLMAVAETPTAWDEDIALALGKFEPVILDCVSEELVELGKGLGRKGKLARVSLELSKGFVRRGCGSAQTDDEIISAALKGESAVATVDNELADSLRKVHVKVIGLRGGRVFIT